MLILHSTTEAEAVRAFRERGARSAMAARALDELSVDVTPVLRRLIDEGTVCRSGPFRFYLDEVVWARHAARRRRPLRRAALALALAGSSVAFFLAR